MDQNQTVQHGERGSASIMVILIIFTLMVFGVFALMSSYSEYKLSKKYATWVQEYYQLDQSGQEFLATLKDKQTAQVPGRVIEMTLENPTLTTKQKLSIKVLVKPEGYEVQQWKQVQNAFELDLTEELWNGESSEGNGN